MAKSSLDYWREREQEANKNAIKDEAAYNKRIKEIYDYTEAYNRLVWSVDGTSSAP